MADMKTAAYICTGCGIGDKLDVKTMEKIATKEGKMAIVKNHAFLCGEEGVAITTQPSFASVSISRATSSERRQSQLSEMALPSKLVNVVTMWMCHCSVSVWR